MAGVSFGTLFSGLISGYFAAAATGAGERLLMTGGERCSLHSHSLSVLPLKSSGRRRGQAGKNQIDDGLHEAVVEGSVAVEQPVVERAVDEIERDLDVGVGRDITALDRPLE